MATMATSGRRRAEDGLKMVRIYLIWRWYGLRGVVGVDDQKSKCGSQEVHY